MACHTLTKVNLADAIHQAERAFSCGTREGSFGCQRALRVPELLAWRRSHHIDSSSELTS